MNKRTVPTILLAGALLAPALPGAAGNPAAGENKAQSCIACHGANGANPIQDSYPILAGQHADYLRYTLKSYRSGERENAVMNGLAKPLSDQDIADLAAYFAEQESPLTVVGKGE